MRSPARPDHRAPERPTRVLVDLVSLREEVGAEAILGHYVELRDRERYIEVLELNSIVVVHAHAQDFLRAEAPFAPATVVRPNTDVAFVDGQAASSRPCRRRTPRGVGCRDLEPCRGQRFAALDARCSDRHDNRTGSGGCEERANVVRVAREDGISVARQARYQGVDDVRLLARS